MQTTSINCTSKEVTAHAAWGVSMITKGDEVYLATTPMFADELAGAYEEPFPLAGVLVAPEDRESVRGEIGEVQMDRGAPWPTVAKYLGIR